MIIDDLHTIYIGVVKKMLEKYLELKIFSSGIRFDSIDEELAENHGVKEISSINGLSCSADWKGKQYLAWLLYHGLPFLLEYSNSKQIIENFMHLSNAVYLLSLGYYEQENVNAAKLEIKSFSESFENIFGEESMGPNYHEILHISDQVEKTGQLYVNSTFHFERLNLTLR